jgi:hypothetical protein
VCFISFYQFKELQRLPKKKWMPINLALLWEGITNSELMFVQLCTCFVVCNKWMCNCAYMTYSPSSIIWQFCMCILYLFMLLLCSLDRNLSSFFLSGYAEWDSKFLCSSSSTPWLRVCWTYLWHLFHVHWVIRYEFFHTRLDGSLAHTIYGRIPELRKGLFSRIYKWSCILFLSETPSQI